MKATLRLLLICGAIYSLFLVSRWPMLASASGSLARTEILPIQPVQAAVHDAVISARGDGNPPHSVVQQATPTRTPTPVNVGNFVWDDLDQDGRQDAGEPGLSGVTVQLWNSTKTQLIDSATTNASGIYSLQSPGPGDYRVLVLLPGPDDEFSPKDNAGDDQLDSDINPTGTNFGFTDIYTFGSNLISITTIDAGIIVYRPNPTRTPTPINIGNFVWHDLNGNGIQDAGEPGVGGVTVQLWNSTKTALIDQATTNSNGNYTVTAPAPGDYRIRVLLPSGASFTLKDQANNQTDSDINPSGTSFGFTDVITIASNVISTTVWDAGLLNVQPSPTPTSTPTGTPTHTPTSTPTITETASSLATSTGTPSDTPTGVPPATPISTSTGTPPPQHQIFVPLVGR